MDKSYSHLLPKVICIARSAGEIILDVYESGDFEAFTKEDETPVTSADLAAHQFILEKLSELTPDIPVLSEEDANVSLAERSKWEKYWLIDPLDGTQEFLARSGDFATVIALVENNRPIMGVVVAPTSGMTYYAYKGLGAWKIPNMHDSVPINTIEHKEGDKRQIMITVSRRQNKQEVVDCMSSDWSYEFIPLGSATLKACLVAEGKADCYLRLGPTGEWDTAATQCIVQEAGGRILSTDLEPLSYNQRDSLGNPNFIVVGDKHLPWDKILCCR